MSFSLTNSHSPKLPWDLQRIVFEEAAKADRHVALDLARVAKHVQVWIEPIIYANIILGPHSGRISQLIDTIAARSPMFFATHVKTLSFDVPDQSCEIDEIISACTGLVSLAIWNARVDNHALALIGSLKLKHLCIDITQVCSGSKYCLLAPMLSSLTHLNLQGSPTPELLRYLPNLTHLAFTIGHVFAIYSHPSHLRRNQEFLRQALASPSLKEFVCWAHQPFADSPPQMRQALIRMLGVDDDPKIAVVVESNRSKYREFTHGEY